jgi:hypothetical protein
VSIEVVYRGRDNLVELTLQRYDSASGRYVPLDLAPVERMVLSLPTTQPRVIFDSQAVSGVIDWTLGQGRVRFNIQQYALPVGGYPVELIAFDPAHPNGQVLIDQYENSTVFEVREVLSDGLLPPPMPSGGTGVVRLAGEEISALRGVYELQGQVFYLDQADDAHINLYLGVTVSSAQAGGEVIVQRSGTIDDASWNWTVGQDVFLGSDGFLTQTAPTTGWQLVVGSAPAATRLNISIDVPVFMG